MAETTVRRKIDELAAKAQAVARKVVKPTKRKPVRSKAT
jgi:hypothetical protein